MWDAPEDMYLIRVLPWANVTGMTNMNWDANVSAKIFWWYFYGLQTHCGQLISGGRDCRGSRSRPPKSWLRGNFWHRCRSHLRENLQGAERVRSKKKDYEGYLESIACDPCWTCMVLPHAASEAVQDHPEVLA